MTLRLNRKLLLLKYKFIKTMAAGAFVIVLVLIWTLVKFEMESPRSKPQDRSLE
jgi:hypothetical protein